MAQSGACFVLFFPLAEQPAVPREVGFEGQ